MQAKSPFGSQVSADSALGSSKDPTPTHKAPASHKSTLDFNDDPFKDSEHRYGDPFDIEGADPFDAEPYDPFTGSPPHQLVLLFFTQKITPELTLE